MRSAVVSRRADRLPGGVDDAFVPPSAPVGEAYGSARSGGRLPGRDGVIRRVDGRSSWWPEARITSTGELGAITTVHGASWRHLVRHYLEMVAAMVVGMVVLGGVIRLIFAVLGYSYFDVVDQTEPRALVMATNMAIGMSLWMRHRGHSWASTGEMAGAMYAPFIILFVPYWAGLLTSGAVLGGGHLLMLACMVVAMVHRRDEYTRGHRRAEFSDRQ